MKCGGSRKTSRKEENRGKNRANLGSLVSGPDSVKVKLKYVERVTMNTLTSTGAWSYAFRLNSVFDPNFTGTGHQPNGFDQWAAFYGKYRVVGGSWRVTYANADVQYPVDLIAVERANDNSVDSSVEAYLQEPRSHYALGAARGAPAVSLGSSFQNQKLLGLDSKEFADQDYAALVTTNPAIQTWLMLFAQVHHSELSSADQAVMVEIWYDVIFYEREELDPSLSLAVPLIREYEKSGDEKVLRKLSAALTQERKTRQ
jgi:hypothetical protein